MENVDSNVPFYDCQWIITNFNIRFSDYDNCGEAHSMIFSTGGDRPIVWHFQLCTDEISGSLIFKIIHNENSNYTVKSQESCLHILNSRGERTELVNASPYSPTKRTMPENYSWSFYKFSKNILFDNAKLFLPNNELSIICRVCVKLNTGPISHQCCQREILNAVERKNFQRLFENDELSDVTIVVDGKEFRVRKTLLTECSPVFEAMFRYDMKEKNENRVIIHDMEPEIFLGMLEYIYTNQVIDIDKIAIGLLAAADRYAIEELKQMCQQSLFRNITIDNIEEIFMLADRYNAKQLIQYYTKYFINPPLVRIINYCDKYFEKF